MKINNIDIRRPVSETLSKSGRDAHLKTHNLHQRYYLDGKQLPGVSAILKNLGWSTNGLLNWQKTLLLKGQDPEASLTEAATLGTVTHQYLEDWIQQRTTDSSHVKPVHQQFAELAVQWFAAWAVKQNFSFLATEQQVISSVHRYGGTFDVLGNHCGMKVLADFKTSKAVYPSHLIQLAGYQIAYDEMYPDEPIEKMAVIKISSEEAQMQVHWLDVEEWAAAREVFLYCRKLHALKKALKG